MQLTDYDPLEYLKDEEDFKLALEAAFEEGPGDGSLVAATLGDIAKAKGMTQLVKETGLSRERLYRSLLGKARPEFGTILKVSRALEFNIGPI